MTPANVVRVLGFSGSLRKASFNTALLRAAVELAPPGVQLETTGIGDIPLYNEDVREQGYPAPVAELRRRVAAADALLITTPEYNYSIPGVLKNAIDWVSRPPDQPFDGKPLALMGASMGTIGTARAQYHLRQTAVFLNMHPLNRPEVMVSRAHERFDASGRLTDEEIRARVTSLLSALAEWTRRLRS